MNMLRDLTAFVGMALFIGSIATQSLWIAGIVLGCILIGGSVWWSWAAVRAAAVEDAKHKRRVDQ